MRALWLLLSCWLVAPAWAGEDASPLVFEPPEVDFGVVREGETAEGWLRIRNSGERMAQIAAIETSCGCTSAEPEARLLAPGAFTRLHVRIDAFAKRGEVQKRVELVDGDGRRSRALIRLRVLPSRHPSALAGRSLFAGECARCHAAPARGLRDGAALYRAVCAMCHGREGEGAYAPRIAGMDAAALRALIANGTGKNAMPAFARARGGPLDDAQIAALAEWLSALDAAGSGR